jgi:hypothetical protein
VRDVIATVSVHQVVTCMGCHLDRTGEDGGCKCWQPSTTMNVPQIEVHIREIVTIRDFDGVPNKWAREWEVTRKMKYG